MSLPLDPPTSDPGGADARRRSSEELRWRIIRDEPRSGSRNMALDHALAASSSEGEAVLRLYGWARPTVSFGRNEPALAWYSREKARALGVDYVRRPTGGRAVLHDQELTYAVVVPERAFGGPRDTYVAVHRGLVRGLERLGVPAVLETRGVVVGPEAGPCFRSPAPGEVVVGGRKLVGSAQVRLEGALLQHGSILLRGDQSLLRQLAERVGEPGTPATLSEHVSEEAIEGLGDALVEGLRRALGGSWVEGAYRATELEEAEGLEADWYAVDKWTWRR